MICLVKLLSCDIWLVKLSCDICLVFKLSCDICLVKLSCDMFSF